MNYLVAVLANKQQAEEAYSTLQQDGIPIEKVTILGEGYQSADDFGLINPNQQASKRVKKLAYWLVPFGWLLHAFGESEIGRSLIFNFGLLITNSRYHYL